MRRMKGKMRMRNVRRRMRIRMGQMNVYGIYILKLDTLYIED